MNSPELHIDAVAIYGSFARRDHDRYSDYDLLLVANKQNQLSLVQKTLSDVGWSVSPYTWKDLLTTYHVNPLFLRHLRDEAIIISDRHKKLRQLLSDIKMPENFEPQFQSALDLARILRAFPIAPHLVLWGLDVLYIITRQLGISTVSSWGYSIYSYPRIIALISNLRGLDDESIMHLQNLRLYKSSYRRRVKFEPLSWSLCLKVSQAINQAFLTNLEFEPMQTESFVDRANALIYDPGLSKYARLRLIEAVLLAHHCIPVSGEVSTDTAIGRLSTLIRQTRNSAELYDGDFDRVLADFKLVL